MIYLIAFFSLLSLTANATTPEPTSCGRALGSGEEWIPDAADRARLVEKIMAQVGEGKRFDDVTGGNRGTHVYLIPHDRTQHTLDVAATFGRARRAEDLRKIYDPKANILAAVLETNDEPLLTLALFAREPGPAFLLPTINTSGMVDVNENLKRLIPEAFGADDEILGAHILWHLVHDGETVELPGVAAAGSWTIESYRGY